MTKKNEEEKAMTVHGETLPDFLRGKETGRGKENMDREDLTIPRIKLLQPMSPEVDEEDSEHRPGTLMNSITGHNYGKSIVFIPLLHSKSRMLWRDREDGGGIQCSAADALHPRECVMTTLNDEEVKTGPTCAQCKLKDWNNAAATDREKAPKCTLYYNFPIVIVGEREPVVLTMERTKTKAARKLLSLAAYTGGNYDIFAKKYKLTVIKDKKNDNQWFNYSIEPVGFVSETEYKAAESLYNSLKNVIIEADTSQPENTEDEE